MPASFMEGSEAIAEAMVTAGCRFFAGYPMTPFTEVLEHMARLLPAVGGTCINAESELEAVGMAWGAAATGARAATGSVGQGLSLMQESISELCSGPGAARRGQHGRGPGRLLPGAPGAAVTATTATSCWPRSTCPRPLSWFSYAFHLADQWRNPVLCLWRLLPRPRRRSRLTIRRRGVRAAPGQGLGARRVNGGTGYAKLVSPLSSDQARTRTASGYGGHLKFVAEQMATMTEGIEPMVETGFVDDAEFVVVAFGTPARYVRYVVGLLREAGCPVGFVRPITLWPFPSDALARAAERRPGACRLRAQRRPDDRRCTARPCTAGPR